MSEAQSHPEVSQHAYGEPSRPSLTVAHVIHKPLAYVMLIIMFVHIGVVIAMGEGVPLDP